MADFGAKILPIDVCHRIWLNFPPQKRMKIEQICSSWNLQMPYKDVKTLTIRVPRYQELYLNWLEGLFKRVGQYLRAITIEVETFKTHLSDVFNLLKENCDVISEISIKSGCLDLADLEDLPQSVRKLNIYWLDLSQYDSGRIQDAFNALRNLEILCVNCVRENFTGERLVFRLPKLKMVKLPSYLPVDISSLTESPITVLWYSRLLDTDLDALGSAQTLRSLQLTRGACNDNFRLAKICESLKNLEFLDISCNENLTDFSPVGNLPKLRALNVYFCRNFGFSICSSLLQQGKLTDLNIGYTAITDNQQMAFLARSSLKRLVFGHFDINDVDFHPSQPHLFAIKDASNLIYAALWDEGCVRDLEVFLKYRIGLITEGRNLNNLELRYFCFDCEVLRNRKEEFSSLERQAQVHWINSSEGRTVGDFEAEIV